MLTPCEATRKSAWHTVIASADSILALWDQIGWRPPGLSWDQVIVIHDSKLGKTMTEQEYGDLVKRLKGR